MGGNVARRRWRQADAAAAPRAAVHWRAVQYGAGVEARRRSRATTSRTCAGLRVCITSSTSTLCADSVENARWWCTSSMLAPASATTAVMRASTPGVSRAADADARQPPGAHHAALDDRGQQQRVDVAAAQHQADLAAGVARRVLEQRRQPGGAGAFDHRLLDLQQHQHGLLDVAFVDEHEVVDEFAHDLARDLPRLPDRDALGDGAVALRVGRALDGVEHGREAAGLHADDLDAGLERAHRGGDAADEPAAAHRDDQRVELRLRAQHLQPDGALAGDHQRVVEGVHEGQALRVGQRQRVVARLVEGRRRAAPPRRRSRACAPPSRWACAAASRSPRAGPGAARGRPRPARGCRPRRRSRP